MTVHHEGYKTIALVAVVLAVVNAIVFYFLGSSLPIFCYAFLTVCFGLWLFIVSFFRVPNRQLTKSAGQVISPADGKVVVIEEIFDTEYFNDRRLQISVFMSPANVHQNRNPISGEVVYNKYHKGKYLVAWDPKSSTENERHSIVVKGAHGEILYKQIAGALAKRIVNYLSVGQQVEQSEEYGFIKFGSRVDLLLPIGTKVNVNLNQVVKGGVTVLATF